MTRSATALLLLVTVTGCSSSPPPWHVPRGEERRFRGTLETCHKLTDAQDGSTNPQAFERCMQNRGFRRARFYDGWFGFEHFLGGDPPL